ncbi:unnamed protein product [Mytilus coruscus]|uniref:Up-regulator of cell proliferation-like domain-containing protein n=1 Tax=Mytilus coruscus TaxID=42192 RepID=A0A6J7ZVL4_MYTCO|nr:unnamed protein product [Mytilus coruscus]
MKLNQPQENESKRKQRRQRKFSLFHPQNDFECNLFMLLSVSETSNSFEAAYVQNCCSCHNSFKRTNCRFLLAIRLCCNRRHKKHWKVYRRIFVRSGYIKLYHSLGYTEQIFKIRFLKQRTIKTSIFLQTFYSRNCPLGTKSVRTLDGTVEASHFVPFGKKKSEENFDDVILFLSLRGDAQQYPLLVDVIKSVSNVVVVLLQTMKLKNDDRALEVLSSIYNTSASIIIALKSSSDSISYDEGEILIEKLESTSKNANCEFNCVELKADGNYRGMDEIVKETRSDIFRCLANTKYIQLSVFSSVVEKSGIPCDFALKECAEGCQLAKKTVLYDRCKIYTCPTTLGQIV